MTEANNTRFNAEAKAWDFNPTVRKASELALQSLMEHIPALSISPPPDAKAPPRQPTLDVLEIGCGTGLLSFLVAPHVKSLVAVDAAEGMIEALKLKIENQKGGMVGNVYPVCALLEDPDDERIRLPHDVGPSRFDLVISHLALHHIPSLEDVLKTMYGCLKDGGMVALTDFEDFGPEASRFHQQAKMEGVERHGLKKEEMERLMRKAGFSDVNVQEAFRLEKRVETVRGGGLVVGNWEMMEFPFVICLGKR